jgi:hypothetical protein
VLAANDAIGAARGNGKVAAHQKINAVTSGFGGVLGPGDKFATGCRDRGSGWRRN